MAEKMYGNNALKKKEKKDRSKTNPEVESR